MVLTLAALVALASCSSASSGGALTLPEPTTTELSELTVTVTDVSSTTEVASTVATTSSTSTSTTTTEVVPLTVLEPATTVLPADIDVTFADAFAVYEQAWAVRLDGARDPASSSVRAQVAEIYDDPFRSELLAGLDVQAQGTLRKVASDDRDPSSIQFVEGIASVEDGSVAQFAVCEVLTDRTIDTATGEVVFDTVVAYANEVRMNKIAGQWRLAEEVTVVKKVGTVCDD